jgi:hypothetical protein
VVPGTKIADAELDNTPVAISPDGHWLAFSIHVEPTGNETAHQTKIVLLSLEGAAGVPGKGSLGDQSAGTTNGADAGRGGGAGASTSAANPIKRIISPDQRISGHAEFTPDGKAIVYPVRAAGVDNLWLQPLDGAAAGKRITNFTSDLIDAYHWSLDGKQLGVLQRHVVSDVVLLRDTSK